MDMYTGTIIAWAPNFEPQDWMFCDGRLLNIRQYQVLYSLLGTTYGGDGVNTFALPNLNGRVPVGKGTNNGVNYVLGAVGGQDSVTLSVNNMPAHSHTASSTPNLTISGLNVQLPASTSDGNTDTPGDTASLAKAIDSSDSSVNIYTTGTTNTHLKPANVTGGTIGGTVTTTIASTGSSTPFNNMQPYQVLNYIICVNGIYPPRP